MPLGSILSGRFISLREMNLFVKSVFPPFLFFNLTPEESIGNLFCCSLRRQNEVLKFFEGIFCKGFIKTKERRMR